MVTDLSKFSIGSYSAGPKWKVVLWFFFNYFIFYGRLPWPYKFKVFLLRLFGCKVGKGLVIKSKVRIKNPWRLSIGDHCWIGEDVWIDNLENIYIGSHVTISQGAMLLTGNHNYSKSDFSYRLGQINLEDGVWIGAKSVVCSGITCYSHSVLTVNSVASKDLNAYQIYSGNPALKIRDRKITS